MQGMQFLLDLFHECQMIIIEHGFLFFEVSIIGKFPKIEISPRKSLIINETFPQIFSLINCRYLCIKPHNFSFHLIFLSNEFPKFFLHSFKIKIFLNLIGIYLLVINKYKLQMLRIINHQNFFVNRYQFGRKKNVDFVRERDLRDKAFERQFQFQYKQPNNQHDDLMFCETIYGRNCYVVGLTPNSASSSRFIHSALLNMNPTHLILGNFNSSKVKTISPFNQSHKLMTQLSIKYETQYHPKDLFCRSVLNSVVHQNVNQNQCWYEEEKTKALYFLDHESSRITTNDYLTAINVSFLKEYMRISFGTPSDLIVFQDLMLNVDVDQLRESLRNIMHRVKQNEKKGTLYRFGFQPAQLQDEIRIQAQKQYVLYDKQLTYITALLNRYSSLYEKVMVLVSHRFAPRVADNVHKTTLAPESIYRNYLENKDSQSYGKLCYYLNSQNRSQKIDELLYKFAVLNWTKNNALQIQLILGQKNIFLKTIFKPLFQSIPLEQIIRRYRKIKAPFKQQFFESSMRRLEFIRLQYKDNQKFHLTLPEQIKTQQQRSIDHPYSFTPANRQITLKKKIYDAKLLKKMDEIVEKFWISEQKQLYEFAKKGTWTQDAIVKITKLMGEARTVLISEDPEFRKIASTKIGKFPIFHFQAFRHFFKQQLLDQINNRGKKAQQLKKKFEQKQKDSSIRYFQVESQEEVDEYIRKHISPNNEGEGISFSFNSKGEPVFEDDNQKGQSYEEMMADLKSKPIFKEVMEHIEKEVNEEQEMHQKLGKDDAYSRFVDGEKIQQDKVRIGRVRKASGKK